MKKKTNSRAKSANSSNGSRFSKIRIVLVDDNELFRAGIKSLISIQKDLSNIWEARDIEQAVDLIKNKKPHLILLNIELKHSDGIQMIPALMNACKTSRLAVLTDSRNPEVHRKAVKSGATGIISKQDPPDLLIDAIHRVTEGGVWLDRFVSSVMFVDKPDRGNRTLQGYKLASLTKREREVIRMIGKGLKNKQIAERLFISDVTVHHHLTSIYSKLQLEDRLELIIFAYKNQLAEIPA